MKEIGGYFELEIGLGKEYHKNALKLNLGRKAFEYILLARNINKIYIPQYTCNAIIEPIKSTNINYDFYQINENLEPVFDYSSLRENEFILITNYYGLKGNFIKKLAKDISNIIVDNSQAFYDKPLKGIDTFYSPRKFFGVPDGGYLYTGDRLFAGKLEIDSSIYRFEHLIGRIEKSSEIFFHNFKKIEESLSDQPIMKMSKITIRLLQSINYKKLAKIRLSNFKYLNYKLGSINRLKIKYENGMIPMVYPLFLPGNNMRNKLAEKKIYVPIYWPNVLEWCNKGSLEYFFSEGILPLPIDHRYDENDMKYIVKFFLNSRLL